MCPCLLGQSKKRMNHIQLMKTFHGLSLVRQQHALISVTHEFRMQPSWFLLLIRSSAGKHIMMIITRFKHMVALVTHPYCIVNSPFSYNWSYHIFKDNLDDSWTQTSCTNSVTHWSQGVAGSMRYHSEASDARISSTHSRCSPVLRLQVQYLSHNAFTGSSIVPNRQTKVVQQLRWVLLICTSHASPESVYVCRPFITHLTRHACIGWTCDRYCVIYKTSTHRKPFKHQALNEIPLSISRTSVQARHGQDFKFETSRIDDVVHLYSLRMQGIAACVSGESSCLAMGSCLGNVSMHWLGECMGTLVCFGKPIVCRMFMKHDSSRCTRSSSHNDLDADDSFGSVYFDCSQFQVEFWNFTAHCLSLWWRHVCTEHITLWNWYSLSLCQSFCTWICLQKSRVCTPTHVTWSVQAWAWKTKTLNKTEHLLPWFTYWPHNHASHIDCISFANSDHEINMCRRHTSHCSNLYQKLTGQLFHNWPKHISKLMTLKWYAPL